VKDVHSCTVDIRARSYKQGALDAVRKEDREHRCILGIKLEVVEQEWAGHAG